MCDFVSLGVHTKDIHSFVKCFGFRRERLKELYFTVNNLNRLANNCTKMGIYLGISLKLICASYVERRVRGLLEIRL